MDSPDLPCKTLRGSAANVDPVDAKTAQCGAAPRFVVLLVGIAAMWISSQLSGCASAMPPLPTTGSSMIRAEASAPLVEAVADAGMKPGYTGAWPLPQGAFALDARLALIERATASIDLQTFVVANDGTARQILRALRDAARRGVRVRLLVDDLYTAGLDPLLSGLAAEPRIEVRVFNPFLTKRTSSGRRLLTLVLEFDRLNHRMHNKLFIADGVAAIVGGRNLADEYFLRGDRHNFIDFDVLLAGQIVGELGASFDRYWNSVSAYSLNDVIEASGDPSDDPAVRRENFEASTRNDRPAPSPAATDPFDAYSLSAQLQVGGLRLVPAEAIMHADAPSKALGSSAAGPPNAEDTLAVRFLDLLGSARSDVLLVTPYFLPGPELMQRLGQLREKRVRVRIVTNSMATSDEPLVNASFDRQRLALLRMGVELYELGLTRLEKLDRGLRDLLGISAGRLHAKLGFIDRRVVMVGSLNLDPRSAAINTELGVALFSEPLATMLLEKLRLEDLPGVYRVVLRPDDDGVRWVSVEPGAMEDDLDVEPEITWWQRLQLLFISRFVPDDQL